MDAVGPRARHWKDRPRSWAFRGMADASWRLLPSALRPKARLDYGGFDYTLGTGRPTLLEQVMSEHALLNEFFNAVDEAGYQVPGDRHELRNEGAGLAGRGVMDSVLGKETWPTDELLPLAALAQHYGVPTRLLDWSTRPYVAVYFAAREAAEWVAKPESRPSGAKSLAIWALNVMYLDMMSIQGRAKRRAPRVVRVPRATNPNLHSQGGIFTFDPASPQDPALTPALDETLVEVDRLVDPGVMAGYYKDYAYPVLRRFTVPIEHGPKLLRMVANEGVTAASIYPGIKGVVLALEERRLWDWVPG